VGRWQVGVVSAAAIAASSVVLPSAVSYDGRGVRRKALSSCHLNVPPSLLSGLGKPFKASPRA
jgi:hypothetical protein